MKIRINLHYYIIKHRVSRNFTPLDSSLRDAFLSYKSRSLTLLVFFSDLIDWTIGGIFH